VDVAVRLGIVANDLLALAHPAATRARQDAPTR
jgi:hypothetical protein